MAAAEERQVAALKQLRGRGTAVEVVRCLSRLRDIASKPDENVLPTMIECARARRET